ncbi:unnamed protein product [Psylliodes chrysocephalus]|uniref:Very-long-chain (3R)-3-hydroxyacyl-CoA dehydratase n=1 Tax=Psylliodes chrysocephalus TaxID=3402493 RepID=A0A9P0GAM5_9CUCU|nr:unnamed protein product [Psylliodes chrysocephala]
MAKEKGAQCKGCASAANGYLIAYNGIQTVGWTYLLFQVFSHYLFTPSVPLYDQVKWTVILFQNAAVLEVVHAATGLVRANPVLTAFQVASRVIVVCGILMATEAPRHSIGLALALLAWSVTEIIRYSMYTLSLLGQAPYFLTWLRYSTFTILYPIGITGELLCIYAAQKEVGENGLYSIKMPNQFNVIFNYQHVLVFLMLLYIPLFPQLFMHMVSQRKKVLGGQKKE